MEKLHKKLLTTFGIFYIILLENWGFSLVLHSLGGDFVKSTGIVRRVDELGRIVLPIELRRTLDIDVRDELEIYVNGEQIVLQKYATTCIFCGTNRGLSVYKDKNICVECARQIGKL